MKSNQLSYHWECVSDYSVVVNSFIPNILEERTRIIRSTLTPRSLFLRRFIKKEILAISDYSTITCLSIFSSPNNKNETKFLYAFPFVRGRIGKELKITEIDIRSNHIEVYTTVKTDEGNLISFFDPNYILYKEKYKIGRKLVFSISALAYELEILEETSFILTDEDAIHWLQKTAREPDFDEDGNVEPIEIITNQLVALMPYNNKLPDIYSFQSPVYRVNKIRSFDIEFYELEVCIVKDPDIFINLYVKKEMFKREPDVGDAVRGTILLQGHYVDCPIH